MAGPGAIVVLLVLRTFLPSLYEEPRTDRPWERSEARNVKLDNKAIMKWMKLLVISSHFGREISTLNHENRRRRRKQNYRVCKLILYLILILLLSGDLEINPGPKIKYPCGVCAKSVRNNQDSIQCDQCDDWTHRTCLKMSKETFQKYVEDEESKFSCPSCDDSEDADENNECFVEELVKFRKENLQKLAIAYLNINSIKSKYIMATEIIYQKLVDIFVLAETKIDESFSDAQFSVEGYQLYRKDRTIAGGGLLAYVSKEIPSRRRPDIEMECTETISIELQVNNSKWLLLAAYKPPSLSAKRFTDDAVRTLDLAFRHYENFLLIGDLNYNMLCENKRKTLTDLCDIFDLKNLIKKATCFTKNSEPSLVDVILTNRPNSFGKTLIHDTGLSDVHHLVACTMKAKLKRVPKEKIFYRCFKNLDEEEFLKDIEQAPLQVAHVFDDLDDVRWAQGTMLNNVINDHIPLKQKKRKPSKAPFMNEELRRAINYKKKLHRNYFRERNSTNWENYRKQRNKVTKLKKKAIKDYFIERCAGGPQSKDFWPTIKPFLGKNNEHCREICLLDDDKVVSEPQDVCEIFNNHFSKVAQDIGRDLSHEEIVNHTSVQKIHENLATKNFLPFEFRPVSQKQVEKYLDKIGNKKATGLDGMSVKILKLIKPSYLCHLTDMINRMFKCSEFPTELKQARITPVFKKEDPLSKKNYRPVSVLPIEAKVFEMAMVDQLGSHFQGLFHPFLSAYRPGFSCQSTLLALTEEWRWAADDGCYAGAILMDLSKAFDCLPHNLMIEKLRAYKLSENAVGLISNYLSDRIQCVKIGEVKSSMMPLKKGVPQGSNLGPILFNTFINDIFYFINKSSLYNYADDNTISYCDKNYDMMKSTLEADGSTLVEWFAENQMQANPEKFQALAIGKKTNEKRPVFSIQGAHIECSDYVKLLGVTIDSSLKFDVHISNICKKTARQINVLKRIGRFLPLSCRKIIYKSFIWSCFNFCPIVWHFCSEGNTKKLEKLNYRALKFVYKDYTSEYEQLLKRDESVPLKIRRQRLMAEEVYKILSNERPVYLENLVSRKRSNYDFIENGNKLNQPRFKCTTIGKNSFKYGAAKLWNDLPKCIRVVENFRDFRKMITAWEGKKCRCAMCK